MKTNLVSQPINFQKKHSKTFGRAPLVKAQGNDYKDLNQSNLSLEKADKIANSVIENMKKNKFNPISISVLDKNGAAVVQKRTDGSSQSAKAPDFSFMNAYTNAFNYLRGSRKEEITVSVDEWDLPGVGEQVSKSIEETGGALLSSDDGDVIGAIGITYTTPREPEKLEYKYGKIYNA